MANTKGKIKIVNVATLAGLEVAVNAAIEAEEAGGWVLEDAEYQILQDDAGSQDGRVVCKFKHQNYSGSAFSMGLLASTSTGEGASLVGVEDAALNFTGATVEAVLAEIIADYAAITTGNGASKIGVEDAGLFFATANVEAVLQEIMTSLAAITAGNGASRIGIQDAALNYDTATVEDALAEIWTDLAALTATNGASRIGIQDVGLYYDQTTVELALQEIWIDLAAVTATNGASRIGVQDVGTYYTATTVETVLQEVAAVKADGQVAMSALESRPIGAGVWTDTLVGNIPTRTKTAAAATNHLIWDIGAALRARTTANRGVMVNSIEFKYGQAAVPGVDEITCNVYEITMGADGVAAAAVEHAGTYDAAHDTNGERILQLANNTLTYSLTVPTYLGDGVGMTFDVTLVDAGAMDFSTVGIVINFSYMDH